ncbi:MAG: hypothetical protein ACREIS_04335, partial [Nitrospiraceae bacterium]
MRPWGLLLLVSVGVLSAGCEQAKSVFGRASVPDMGPRLPVTVKLELDPALTNIRLQYSDACNSPREIRLGPDLEDTILQAAHQNFKVIYATDKNPAEKPDIQVYLALQQSGLQIQTDNVYDRLPAEIKLEAVAVYRDPSGKVIQERPLKATRKERLLLEPTQHRCEYSSMDAFVHDTAVTFATQFVRETRAIIDPDNQMAQAGQAPAPPAAQRSMPGGPVQPAGTALSFKATLLDENGNLILEGGERVRVRVDLVNTGAAPVQSVSISLAGTPALLTQFPATALQAGTLQPGESRSLEFAATVPPGVQAQRLELQVVVAGAGSTAPTPQTIVAAMRSRAEVRTMPGESVSKRPVPAVRFDHVSIDQVPTAAAGFQQPQAQLLAIGISSYRDQSNSVRKYAAADAELVAAYFQALGGVPSQNVRVLQDRKALRFDIEEALLDWLPTRVTRESLVIVYFAGQALVSPSGETYLVPYEGGAQAPARLYPVKDLQAALGKLNARLALLIFDGGVSRLGGNGRAGSKLPQWDTGGKGVVRLIASTGFQNGLEPAQLRHGLFTYYLLRGLRGEADKNQDAEVTLGELTAFLQTTVPAASKAEFR